MVLVMYVIFCVMLAFFKANIVYQRSRDDGFIAIGDTGILLTVDHVYVCMLCCVL